MSAVQQTYTDEFLPIVQVRHKSVLYFDLWQGHRKGRSTEEMQDVQKRAYSGQVSEGAKKRMRKAIDLLLQLSPERIIYNPVAQCHHPFTINFVTLTVSDTVNRPHKEVMKKCLQPFLAWVRKRGAKHYIWKAELQERGQIHYHITLNQFIHFAEIRKMWNKYQRKAGYLNTYAQQHGHYNPNSTDVHSVVNVKDIEAYLVKYIVKEVSKQGSSRIDGKVWGCSESLEKSFYATECEPCNVPAVKPANQWIEKDRFAIYKVKSGASVLNQYQHNLYVSYLSNL